MKACFIVLFFFPMLMSSDYPLQEDFGRALQGSFAERRDTAQILNDRLRVINRRLFALQPYQSSRHDVIMLEVRHLNQDKHVIQTALEHFKDE